MNGGDRKAEICRDIGSEGCSLSLKRSCLRATLTTPPIPVFLRRCHNLFCLLLKCSALPLLALPLPALPFFHLLSNSLTVTPSLLPFFPAADFSSPLLDLAVMRASGGGARLEVSG